MNKTIVVLGMHKTGTSLIGGVLNTLGVNMGKKMVGVRWSNPKGHFEDKKFLELNNKILEEAGGTWYNPPKKENILALKENFSSEIEKLIQEAESETWGWKDPRTSLMMEFYLPHLNNPYFIVCWRNEEDIIKSLLKRHDNNLSEKDALDLIKVYNNELKKFLKQNPNLKVLNLKYEDVLASPKEHLDKLISFLDLKTSEEQYKKALNFILPREKIEKLSEEMKKEQEKAHRSKRRKEMFKKGLQSPWKIPRFLWKKIFK